MLASWHSRGAGGHARPASGGLPVSGARIWFDASDDATITFNASDILTAWEDKSGNGHDVTVVTGSPLKSTLNTLVCVQGTAAWNCRLPASATAGLGNATVFAAVVDLGSSFGGRNGHWLESDTNGFNSHFGGSVPQWYDGFGGSGRPFLPGTVTTGQTFIASIRRSGNTITPRLNGVDGAGQTSAVAWKPDMRIGQVGNTWFNGKIGEIVLFPSLLSASDITLMDDYMTDKWGVI